MIRHDLAMTLADNAMEVIKSQPDLAKSLFFRAYQIEISIARSIPNCTSSEPTRGILYRSSASLANNAGMGHLAIEAANEGLKGQIQDYPFLFDELNKEVKRGLLLTNKKND